MQDIEQWRRFLAKLRLEIRKLCVVKIYSNIEEAIVAIVKIEKVLGELGETLYEPMKEEHDKMAFGEFATNQ